jgi:hypothetical protein
MSEQSAMEKEMIKTNLDLLQSPELNMDFITSSSWRKMLQMIAFIL